MSWRPHGVAMIRVAWLSSDPLASRVVSYMTGRCSIWRVYAFIGQAVAVRFLSSWNETKSQNTPYQNTRNEVSLSQATPRPDEPSKRRASFHSAPFISESCGLESQRMLSCISAGSPTFDTPRRVAQRRDTCATLEWDLRRRIPGRPVAWRCFILIA